MLHLSFCMYFLLYRSQPAMNELSPRPEDRNHVICQKVSHRVQRNHDLLFVKKFPIESKETTICYLSKSFPPSPKKPRFVICQKVSHRVQRNHDLLFVKKFPTESKGTIICYFSKSFPPSPQKPLICYLSKSFLPSSKKLLVVICQKVPDRVHRNH